MLSTTFRPILAHRADPAPDPGPQILTHTTGDPIDPIPTPDGKSVIFADGTDDEPLSRDVYVVGMDGQNLNQLTHRPELSYQPAVSPDGTKIAYVVEKDGLSDVHVMNVDGTGDANITNTNKGYWEPQWSADGKNVVVTSRDTKDGNLELVQLAADGSAKKQLTHLGYNTDMQKFSPDGSHVLFGLDPAMGAPVLCSMKADGTDVKPYATDLILAGVPTISPSGQVVFSGIDQNSRFDIYSVNIDSDAPPTRLENSGMAMSPQFSPDGAHVAWVAQVGDSSQIFEANADGSNAHAVTSGPALHDAPHYTPDGNSLLYISDESGKFEVYRAPRPASH